MFDAYDEAIAYFQQHPGEIEAAWLKPNHHMFGYLFQFMTPDGLPGRRPDGKQCGDPVQVKSCDHWVNHDISVAWTEELTMALRRDEYLPKFFGSMLPHAQLQALQYIANAQRLADRMLGRRVPNEVESYVGSGI